MIECLFWIIKIGQTGQKLQALKNLQTYTISIANREDHAYLWTSTVDLQIKLSKRSGYYTRILNDIISLASLNYFHDFNLIS